MSPYRIATPPEARMLSWSARWRRAKRAIINVRSLSQWQVLRRWSGGNWARVALLPVERLVIVGSGALDDVIVRWRPVDSCPHGPQRGDDMVLRGCSCEAWS